MHRFLCVCTEIISTEGIADCMEYDIFLFLMFCAHQSERVGLETMGRSFCSRLLHVPESCVVTGLQENLTKYSAG